MDNDDTADDDVMSDKNNITVYVQLDDTSTPNHVSLPRAHICRDYWLSSERFFVLFSLLISTFLYLYTGLFSTRAIDVYGFHKFAHFYRASA